MVSVHRRLDTLIAVVLALSGVRSSPGAHDTFWPRQGVGHVMEPVINEASGLAASRKHPDVLYTINDSGDSRNLTTFYAISATNASLLASLHLLPAENCDWEGASIGPGPGGHSYIYIGDFGGNSNLGVCNTLYRIQEPEVLQDVLELQPQAVARFQWPETNCETLMVDTDGTVYLLSKVDPGGTPKLYQLPDSAWGAQQPTVLSQGSAVPATISLSRDGPVPGPVGGDISKDGKEILVKQYDAILYWQREADDILSDVMMTTPRTLTYIQEQQGEAICWATDGSGFYTLSEGFNQMLWFYPRTANSASSIYKHHMYINIMCYLWLLVLGITKF